ncbi:hypothetical protein [Serratia marcescens]|uniref:hypothetical protein n=1 Tax=Serratia marcescens TaxID=615 RepID=UPI001374D8E3|nr:hypothetical protein [Serratia marcescens]
MSTNPRRFARAGFFMAARGDRRRLFDSSAQAVIGMGKILKIPPKQRESGRFPAFLVPLSYCGPSDHCADFTSFTDGASRTP